MPDWEADTNVLRTRLPLTISCIATRNNPHDLHALDTPPTFVLSQDQTLSKISILRQDFIPERLLVESLRSINNRFDCGHSSVVKFLFRKLAVVLRNVGQS